jgi:phasin family protein
MAKAAETAKVASSPVEGFDYQLLIDGNSDNLAAVMKSSEAVLQGMTSLGNEVVSFAGKRIEENMATSQDLTQCRDVEQAFRLQCDFARKATEQYLEEARKMMDLASSMARESFTPFEERTRQTLRRMNGG